MATWGYVLEATYSKLGISQEIAQDTGSINRFMYAANEALVEISANVKPAVRTVEFEVMLDCKFDEAIEEFDKRIDNETATNEERIAVANEKKEWLKTHFLFDATGTKAQMPYGYITLSGEEILFWTPEGCPVDSDGRFTFFGNDMMVLKDLGKYRVTYFAYWKPIKTDVDEETELEMPLDIITLLPTYLCYYYYKLDNEQKAAIFRNEYELGLTRLNDFTLLKSQPVFKRRNW